MKEKFLEAGQIVNTHGIRGEVKIVPWADSPEFLLRFKKLYIDGSPAAVLASYVHKGAVIALLEGVDDVDKAAALKEKTVYIDRADARLPDGRYFIRDVIGAEVLDFETGESAGTVKDVISPGPQSVFVLDCDGAEVLVPDVPEFIKEVDTDGGFVKIRFIEGMR